MANIPAHLKGSFQFLNGISSSIFGKVQFALI